MKTPLEAGALARNFADLHPPLSPDEARAEAARCLCCWDAPCTRACPAGIDVPGFIRQILDDNPAGAAEIIFRDNVLGGSCARACPTEVLCEGFCVARRVQDGPVRIGRLQRFATDHATDRGEWAFAPGPDTGRKVAVVGSGPAGLACAHELRILGHAVTIFEARDVPGGLNTWGLSAYKVTTAFALQEVEPVRRMGAEIRLSTPVAAADVRRLLADHDAVFLGVGLGATARLGIPGEDAEGVMEALAFILPTHAGPLTECEVGREVVVIGGGNTAIDAATQAVRLGAERVTIVYRRTAGDMPAFRYEYELARADGVRFEWLAQPVAFRVEDGRVAGVRCRRVRPRGKGRGGKLEPVAGSAFEMACDLAVVALGQVARRELLEGIEGLALDGGRVVVDPTTFATSVPGLFAGGDCVNGGAELVHAVEHGKRAARGIDGWLASRGAGGAA